MGSAGDTRGRHRIPIVRSESEPLVGVRVLYGVSDIVHALVGDIAAQSHNSVDLEAELERRGQNHLQGKFKYAPLFLVYPLATSVASLKLAQATDLTARQVDHQPVRFGVFVLELLDELVELGCR